MRTLYVTCGVAFSGKSTLAKRLAALKHADLVSQDDIWFEKEKEWNLDENSDRDWERILEISKKKIIEHLSNGHSVVFDDINLTHNDRETLRKIANEFEARFVIIYLDTPQTMLDARREKNKETKERHQVTQELIDWARRKLEVPQESENAYIFKPDMNMDKFLNTLP